MKENGALPQGVAAGLVIETASTMAPELREIAQKFHLPVTEQTPEKSTEQCICTVLADYAAASAKSATRVQSSLAALRTDYDRM